MSTATTGVPVRERVPLRRLTGGNGWLWHTHLNVYPSGNADRPPDSELVVSALLNILDAVRNRPVTVPGTGRVLAELSAIRAALVPPAKPAPKAEREAREAASRKRAWAAYKRAGGTMEPEPGGDTAAPSDPIQVLNLSVRARNALTRHNCRTLADVVRYSGDELLDLKNFGQTSLDEVRGKLAKFGLALKGDPAPEAK